MCIIEFVVVNFLILLYSFFFIKKYKKPSNYEQLILVKGLFLVIGFLFLNIWFYKEDISILKFTWQSIKNIF